jgi:anti-sigma regulatory factor (Ser/Thr protein kinase)
MGTPEDPPILCLEGTIDASLEAMSEVHRLIAEFWQQLARVPVVQPDATWRALFESATAEIAGNIVRHAYTNPSSTRHFHLSLCCYHDSVVATTLDEGMALDPLALIGTPNMDITLEDEALDGGWGLPIAQAATDGLDYQRLASGQNQWRIDKHFVKR